MLRKDPVHSWIEDGIKLRCEFRAIWFASKYVNGLFISLFSHPCSVEPKVSLDLTTLSLQSDLEQSVLIEHIHATRHKGKVRGTTIDCENTKQDTFGVPSVNYTLACPP